MTDVIHDQNDRHQISIMNSEDQFNLAWTLLGFLEHHQFKLDDEQEEELIDIVMSMTDQFSIGFSEIIETED